MFRGRDFRVEEWGELQEAKSRSAFWLTPSGSPSSGLSSASEDLAARGTPFRVGYRGVATLVLGSDTARPPPLTEDGAKQPVLVDASPADQPDDARGRSRGGKERAAGDEAGCASVSEGPGPGAGDASGVITVEVTISVSGRRDRTKRPAFAAACASLDIATGPCMSAHLCARRLVQLLSDRGMLPRELAAATHHRGLGLFGLDDAGRVALARLPDPRNAPRVPGRITAVKRDIAQCLSPFVKDYIVPTVLHTPPGGTCAVSMCV
jgi:hypothetical protein